MNRDSIEVIEQKPSLHIDAVRVRTDLGGTGEHRGARGTVVPFCARAGDMAVRWNLAAGVQPPPGTRGGRDGTESFAFKRARNGE